MLLAANLGPVSALGEVPPLEVTWEERTKIASGGGHQGPWNMNESEFVYIDDPTVAVTDQGIAAVSWADNARKDIFFQCYTPDGKELLEEPTNVSRSPRIFSWLPRMVVTSDDPMEVYILWQEIVFSGGTHGGEVFFARSTDGGRTFGEPLNLSKDIAGSGKGRLTKRRWSNGSLDLARGPEGDLYAAWTDYEGNLWFRRSTNEGTGFSERLQIADPDHAGPARGPSLAVGAAGDIYLAWTVGEDEAADIHFSKSEDAGRSFNEPRVIHDSEGHSDAPKIAVDSKRKVHLLYGESPDGLFGQYHVLYASSTEGGRTFELPREISSPRSDQFESASFPAMSLDREDNLYIVWELSPGSDYRSRGLGFTCSSDGGRTFMPASLVPGTGDPALGFNGSLQGGLMQKIAVNRAGNVAVVNSTFKRNKASHVWLFRGRAKAH